MYHGKAELYPIGATRKKFAYQGCQCLSVGDLCEPRPRYQHRIVCDAVFCRRVFVFGDGHSLSLRTEGLPPFARVYLFARDSIYGLRFSIRGHKNTLILSRDVANCMI